MICCCGTRIQRNTEQLSEIRRRSEAHINLGLSIFTTAHLSSPRLPVKPTIQRLWCLFFGHDPPTFQNASSILHWTLACAMCGIHASISTAGFQAPSDGLKQLLLNRGPDHCGEVKAVVQGEDGDAYSISLTSTVLALRGGRVTAQPLQLSASGCILCWNGEAWAVGSSPVVGNDGQVVFDLLSRASSLELSPTESVTAVLTVLRSISGPFAFVFLDTNHGFMYLGRDRLGRRSLLFNTVANTSAIEFSSCADPFSSGWKEVEADGIYKLSFSIPSISDGASASRNALSQSLVPCQRHSWEAHNSLSTVSLIVYSKSSHYPSGASSRFIEAPNIILVTRLWCFQQSDAR